MAAPSAEALQRIAAETRLLAWKAQTMRSPIQTR